VRVPIGSPQEQSEETPKTGASSEGERHELRSHSSKTDKWGRKSCCRRGTQHAAGRFTQGSPPKRTGCPKTGKEFRARNAPITRKKKTRSRESEARTQPREGKRVITKHATTGSNQSENGGIGEAKPERGKARTTIGEGYLSVSSRIGEIGATLFTRPLHQAHKKTEKTQ